MVEESELEFDSSFEGGNLDLALKVKEGEYDLLMRTDSNTKGHHQWFYFSVKNKSTGTFKFSILNFTKENSLHQQGMRIAIYSKKKSSLAKIGDLPQLYINWHNGGDNITYNVSKLSTDNGLNKKGHVNNLKSKQRIMYYALSFEYTFGYIDDEVYFAYSVPYTFTDLQSLLAELKTTSGSKAILKQEVLCKTLSGINVPLLTISEDMENLLKEEQSKKLNTNKKQVVVVTARIHPGETCGSFMMQGFLRFIISSNPIAKQLRTAITFKVVPMINIDGVILGNYRSCLCGHDLNRKFYNPNPHLHPEIIALKNLLYKLRGEDKEVLGYLDMHAHSKKKCVFIYGPYYPLHSSRYSKVRVYANLLGKCTEMFRYRACKYREEQDKMTAARLVISKEFGIMNSFTIEASFYGFLNEERKLIEFDINSHELMGKYICQTLLEYIEILKEEKLNKLKHPSKNTRKQYNETKKQVKKKLSKNSNEKLSRLEEIYNDIRKEVNDDTDSDDSDSNESEPEAFSKEEEVKNLDLILSIVKKFHNDTTKKRISINKWGKKLREKIALSDSRKLVNNNNSTNKLRQRNLNSNENYNYFVDEIKNIRPPKKSTNCFIESSTRQKPNKWSIFLPASSSVKKGRVRDQTPIQLINVTQASTLPALPPKNRTNRTPIILPSKRKNIKRVLSTNYCTDLSNLSNNSSDFVYALCKERNKKKFKLFYDNKPVKNEGGHSKGSYFTRLKINNPFDEARKYFMAYNLMYTRRESDNLDAINKRVKDYQTFAKL